MGWFNEHILIVSGKDEQVKAFKEANGGSPSTEYDKEHRLDILAFKAMAPDIDVHGHLESVAIRREGKGFVTYSFDVRKGDETVLGWLEHVSRIFDDLRFELYVAFEYEDYTSKCTAEMGRIQYEKLEPALPPQDVPLEPKGMG